MGLKATLTFSGSDKEYTVLECEYDFEQSTDVDGRPDDGVRGGKIFLTIATPAHGCSFYEWMFHDFQQRDGFIELNVNADSKSFMPRYIAFEGAFCVGLHDYFNNNNSVQMTTRVTIQAARIAFSDAYGEATGIDIFSKELVDGNFETVFKRDSYFDELPTEGASRGLYKEKLPTEQLENLYENPSNAVPNSPNLPSNDNYVTFEPRPKKPKDPMAPKTEIFF